MVKRLVRLFQSLEIAALILILLICMAPIPFGFASYAVLSGSMEPEISEGSLIYVDSDVSCEKLRVGDIIAFDNGEGKIITHRVVSNNVEEELISTKGDANNKVDASSVPYKSVVGETVWAVPFVGYGIMYLTENKLLLAILFIVVNVFLIMAVSLEKTYGEIKGRRE